MLMVEVAVFCVLGSSAILFSKETVKSAFSSTCISRWKLSV